jgi:hypothetical protein
MEIKCRRCELGFKAYPCEIGVRFYCSRACMTEDQRGRKASPETRSKMSATQKRIGNHPPLWTGKKQSAGHVAKKAEANRGKKRTDALRESIRRRMLGTAHHRMPHSDRTRRLLASYRGSTRANWKGGVTALNKLIRGSARFREWRTAVYRRDSWKCVQCSKPGGWNRATRTHERLEAHHIIAFSSLLKHNQITSSLQAQQCEALWNVNNGQTLCHDCHKQTDNYMHKQQKNLKAEQVEEVSLMPLLSLPGYKQVNTKVSSSTPHDS